MICIQSVAEIPTNISKENYKQKQEEQKGEAEAPAEGLVFFHPATLS